MMHAPTPVSLAMDDYCRARREAQEAGSLVTALIVRLRHAEAAYKEKQSRESEASGLLLQATWLEQEVIDRGRSDATGWPSLVWEVGRPIPDGDAADAPEE